MFYCNCFKSITFLISYHHSSIYLFLFKKYVQKLLRQKIHFQNCSLKEYIFKIIFSKITFLKISWSPSKKRKKKKIQKMHFQSCFLTKYEKYIFKNIFSECINFIVLIYSSSESLGKLSKPLIICLTTFFLMYLHSFKNTFRYCKCGIQADYS